MNKAICTKRLIDYTYNDGIIIINEGEIVEYTTRDKKFIVRDHELSPASFFNHFEVMEGIDKMIYSDFEYILCNYVFTMAVLFPNEYDDQHHLVIQDQWSGTIMITVNERKDTIRVSFADKQVVYSTYEDALEGIRNHK